MASHIMKTFCLLLLFCKQITSSESETFGLDTLFSQPGDIIPGLSTISVVQEFVDIANADTTKEALATFCIQFGPRLDGVVDDEMVPGLSNILGDFGVDLGSVCETVLNAVDENSPIEGVADLCDDLWKGIEAGDLELEELAGFLDELPGNGKERKRRDEDEDDDDFFSTIWSHFSKYNIPRFIETISGEILTADGICNAAATVLYNDTLTLEQFVDHALDISLNELPALTSMLCDMNNGSGSESVDEIEQILTQIISEFIPANVDLAALSDFEPIGLLTAVITHVGQFDNVDDMCENIGLDVPGFAGQAKATIYTVISDANSCSGVLDSVESSTNLQVIYAATGISSNEILCEALVAIFDQTTAPSDGFIGNIMNAGSFKNIAVILCEAVIGSDSGICNLIAYLPRGMLVGSCTQYITPLLNDPESLDIDVAFSLINDTLNYLQNVGPSVGLQMSAETLELIQSLGELMNSIESMEGEDLLALLNDTLHDRGSYPISDIFVMIEETFGFEIPVPPELVADVFDMVTSESELGTDEFFAMLNDTLHDRGSYPISEIFVMIEETFGFEIPVPPELVADVFDMLTSSELDIDDLFSILNDTLHDRGSYPISDIFIMIEDIVGFEISVQPELVADVFDMLTSSELDIDDLFSILNDTLHDRGSFPISAIYAIIEETFGFDIPLPLEIIAEAFDMLTSSEWDIDDLFSLLNDTLHDTGPLPISAIMMFMEDTFGLEIPPELLMIFSDVDDGIRIDRLLIFVAQLLEIPVPSSEEVCYDLDSFISTIITGISGSAGEAQAFIDQMYTQVLEALTELTPLLCHDADGSYTDWDEDSILNAIGLTLPQWITNRWPSHDPNVFNFLMPMESARALVARFGMYEDGHALCEEVANIVASEEEENNDHLDRFVDSMKSSVKLLLLNVSTCNSILNVVEDTFDLQVYELIGLDSNKQLCEIFIPILNTTNIANNSETEMLFLGELFASQTKELIAAIGEEVHGIINEVIHIVAQVSCVGYESDMEATQAPFAGDPITQLFSELSSGLSMWDVVYKKPFKILRGVVANLAAFESGDVLCADVESLSKDIANTIKTNVLLLTEDASTCSSVIDTIEAEFDLQFLYDLLEISDNSDLCNFLVSTFNSLRDPNGTCADIFHRIEEDMDIGFLFNMLGLSGSGQMCEVLVPAIAGFISEDYTAIELTFLEMPIAAGAEELVDLIQGAVDDVLNSVLGEAALGAVPMLCPGNSTGGGLIEGLASLNLTYTIEVARAVITSLGEYGDSGSLCTDMFDTSTRDDGINQLSGLVDTMWTTFSLLTENVTDCVNLLTVVESEVDLVQIYGLLELQDSAELCAMIAKNESIDVSFLVSAFNMETIADTQIMSFSPFDIISLFADVEHREIMHSCYEFQREFTYFFPLNGTDMCGLVANLTLSNFGHVCGDLFSPFFDIFPRDQSWECSFCDDPFSKAGPFNELLYLLEVRFGLNDILNGYDICSASMEALVADQNEIIDFVRAAGESVVFNILRDVYVPSICTLPEREDEPAFVDGMSEIMTVLLEDADEGIDILPEGVCVFLEYAIAAEDEDISRGISMAVTSKVFEVFENIDDACMELADAVSELLSAVMGDDLLQLTEFSSHSSICANIMTSFTGESDPELPSIETIVQIFLNPEEILSTLPIEDMISMLGSIYAAELPAIDVIGLLCDQYGEMINLLGIDDLLGGLDVNGICTAVQERDLYYLSSTCRNFVVPLLIQERDERRPPPMSILALENIDIVREILKALLPLVEAPVWKESDVVCPAADTLINSQFSPMLIAEEVLQHWVLSGIEMTAEVCRDWANVYEFNKPFDYNESPGVAFEYNTRVNKTWLAVANILGIQSAGRLCETAVAAIDLRNKGRIDRLKDNIITRVFSMFDNVEACSEGLNGVMTLLKAQGVHFGGMNPIHLYTGYLSAQAFCIDFMDIINGVDPSSGGETTCFGIVDCAGVCNGDAKVACDGTCGGSAVRDCAGICDGEAVINECNYCVFGSTRRPAEFGQDRCGVCWSTLNYRQTWDCHGTCDGTAFYDDCGKCVGGETGRSTNHNDARIDCRGVCNGGWIEDTCGYCEPLIPGSRINPETESRYEDCSDTCFLPGSSNFAYENICGVCIGGSTGLSDESGINACGQCESDPGADEASCAGCDGTPNSGLVLDACGVCGGTGTTCFGIGWVQPDFIQEDTNITYEAIGAGFTQGSTFQCIFIPSSGSQILVSASWISVNRLTCDANLPEGDYTVRISKDGAVGTEVEASLSVIASISFTGLDQTDVTLERAGAPFEITLTAEEADAFAGMSGIPHAIVMSAFFPSGQRVFQGTYGSDDTTMVFDAEMPPRSSQFFIFPSFDGVNALTVPGFEGFQLTFWAQAPNVTRIAFDSSGAALVVHFDSSVEYSTLQTCDAIFSDTSLFGDGARCIWRGTKTVYVIIGSGNNLVNIGDTVELKANAVLAFHQEFSYSASGSAVVEGPDNPVRVSAVLTGTKKITSCGSVRLSGRLSQGGAGRPMTFSWSISSSVGSAASSVSVIQTDLDDVSSADLLLAGSLLDADVPYTFTMTAANFLGESSVAVIEVVRSAIAVPEVEIIPKGVDVSQTFVSQSFDLKAKVTFYADCVPPGETSFSWDVDNDDVILNLKTASTSSLHVDANSLPGDANITFQITIFKSSEPDKNVTQSITITTVYSELIPVIRGGDQLTIGRDSGDVSIDGSASFDPDMAAVDMTYFWLCEQATDGTACWSFKEGEGGTMFPNATAAIQSVLSFDALSMEADKTYTFTLVVTKGSRSAEASVTVLALDGDPPRVVIAAVNGKVKSDKPLSLTARLFHKTDLGSILWETVDTDQGYAYLDLTDEDNLASPIATHDIPDSQSSINFLNVKPGKLIPGSSYVFQLNVTSVDDQYGLAKIQVDVLADITSCVFSLDGQSQYTELDSITYVTENCAADETAYPLSYQIFVVRDDQGTLEAVSQRQYEPSISGVGKPAREGTSSNIFVVEVCDKFINCAGFNTIVDVTVKTTFTEEEVTGLVDDLVTQEKYKLSFLRGLVNFNMITTKVGAVDSRRRRAVATPETSSTTAVEQLDLMESVIESTVLDTSTAQLQIDQLQFMDIADLSLADRSRLLDILITLVGVYEAAEDESIPDTSADIILDLSGEIRSGLDTTNHATLIEKVSSIESILTQSQVSELSLGGDAVETISEYLTKSVRLAIPSGDFQTKSSGSNAAIVDFGADIASRFGANWACSSGSCSGVNIQFEQYETDVDYLSITSQDQNNRAGDVVSITLLDPESGEELSVTDLTTPITITMTITIPQTNKEYECRYWNDTLSEWASNGLTTTVISTTQVECDTTHLTSYSVIAVDPPTTAAIVTTKDSGPGPGGESGGISGNLLIIIIACVNFGVILIVLIVVIVICRLKMKPNKQIAPEQDSVKDNQPEVVTVPVAMRTVSLSSIDGVEPSTDYASVVNEKVPEPVVYLPPLVAGNALPPLKHRRVSLVHQTAYRESPIPGMTQEAYRESPIPGMTQEAYRESPIPGMTQKAYRESPIPGMTLTDF